MQNNTLLRITSSEHLQRNRDTVDYSFREIRELSSDEDEINARAGTSSQRYASNIDDKDLANFDIATYAIDEQEEFSQSDYSQSSSSSSSSGEAFEASELMSSDEDEFDIIVTRGQLRSRTPVEKKTGAKAKANINKPATKAKPAAAKKTNAKENPKPKAQPRVARSTRASSVRF